MARVHPSGQTEGRDRPVHPVHPPCGGLLRAPVPGGWCRPVAAVRSLRTAAAFRAAALRPACASQRPHCCASWRPRRCASRPIVGTPRDTGSGASQKVARAFHVRTGVLSCASKK